ncbi:MAG TPA: alanine racemase [Abditibacteriaceae bacterium]|jgi:alanine racemase
MNVWIEVNRAALRRNFEIAQSVAGDAKIIAVIKANAYGHGAVECARVFAEAGAAMLAVTRLDEASPIRDAGIDAPILLLAPVLPDECEEAVVRDLTCCVNAFDDAHLLSQAAAKQGKTARVHLKINTGMGRLGVEPKDAVAVAERIAALPNLALDAAWTHFAFAGEPDEVATKKQFALLDSLRAPLAPFVSQFHCANSSALLRFPEMRLDFARPGTMLYGQFPSAAAGAAAKAQNLSLADTWKAKARVVALRDVKAGQTVGYGGEWRASKPSRIATLAIGFADGLSQQPETREVGAFVALQNAAKNLARRGRLPFRTAQFPSPDGRMRAPIVGRIAMQSCSVDVTGMPVHVGDAMDILLRRTSAGAHLPRVYVDETD